MRVLFTTHTPPSHFLPLQPLALAMQRAGHDVAVATGTSLVSEVSEPAGMLLAEARVYTRFYQPGPFVTDLPAPAWLNELSVESGPGGSQIQVEDPDGNPIELHQPSWTR